MKVLALVVLASSLLVTPACVGSSIHGLSEAEWLGLLAAGESLPLPETADIDYGQLARLGPGALLFLSMHASDQGDEGLSLALLRAAVDREEGMYRRRAAELLADRLEAGTDDAAGKAMLDLARSEGGSLLSPFRRSRLEASGLAAVGRHREAAAAIAALRAAWPAEAAADAARLYIASLSARLRSGDRLWTEDFSALSAMDGGTAVYAALGSAVAIVDGLEPVERDAATAVLGPDILELGRARALTGARDFGPATEAWKRCAALARPAASDAAKAFLGAARDEGEAAFAILANAAGQEPAKAYFYRYWYGRFLREREAWKEARLSFDAAVPLAPSAADRDAAAWYALECLGKYDEGAVTSALGAALAASRNPAYYSDIIEPLSRSFLAAGDGRRLAALEATVSAKATGRGAVKDEARLAYVCARAAELGVITAGDIAAAGSDPAGYAASRYAVALSQRDEPYYRLMAAYRLGQPLSEALAEQDAPADAKAVEAAAELSAYALAMARFGLGQRLRAELGQDFQRLPLDTVRAVARALLGSGKPDQALRLIATQFWKDGFRPTRVDAELYWPRPYADAFARASADTGLPVALIYGLARSESAFEAGAVSKSGAVGLTQLLPTTAEEQARRLKMADYSLTDPADNLELGSSYFARIMESQGGVPLAAVFSYNAGPTRYRRWAAELAALPLDLRLEALSYAETRQYGRNVLTAALNYELLYGGTDGRAFLAYLVGEGEGD